MTAQSLGGAPPAVASRDACFDEFASSDGLTSDHHVLAGQENPAPPCLQQLERLKKSQVETEQFVIMAAHDLRSPLLALSGCIELLSDAGDPSAPLSVEELRGCMRDEVRRLSETVDNLLHYGGQALTDLNPQPCSLAEVLTEVMAGQKADLAASEGLIQHENLGIVYADPVQLRFVLQNLIENAIKYAYPRPPRIRVSQVDSCDEAVIRVTDNGCGIAPHDRDRIFSMFQRVDRARPGSGVGLASCKRIIELHGGRIWVESTVGTGSDFCFTLPWKLFGSGH